MRVISLNLARAEPIAGSKKSSLTGIYKRAVDGPVRIVHEGIPGDAICNKKYHGGPDQAIYVYGQADYAWWEQSLGRPLPAGIFGENLTIAELESSRLSIGDRFYIRDLILEVTAPRVPCATLAARMGDSSFVKKFRVAERPGVYCRVIQEGTIAVGDPVRLEAAMEDSVSILEIYRDAFAPTKDAATLRRHLAAPLAVRMRLPKEKLLKSLIEE